MKLWKGYRELVLPKTGRLALQLTEGEGFTYPLYFYIPSITRDERLLVYHRAAQGEVQLWRLELATGENCQLTHATWPDTQWRPWCTDAGRGVLDHRSVLNVVRDEAIYFDGPEVRAVNVFTLEDRHLFSLPPGREAYGQNCCTPSGRFFVYIHVPEGSMWGKPCHRAALESYDFETGKVERICTVDSAIFHVTAYDEDHLIVTHPADHPGMLLVDRRTGSICLLRDNDPGARGHPIHCHVTTQGITYEVPDIHAAGLYDPFTRARFEFPLAREMHYVHTGRDPEGKLWFFESSTSPERFDHHRIYYLRRLNEDGSGEWIDLTGDWPTFGAGQKAHFHPQLVLDRKWIMLTAGDERTGGNHIFLLDISDLPPTEGISRELLHPAGANDRVDVKLL
ncbi:MAG: hypothetical protein NZ899_01890 [Thermoguttaceae bacterium]|nr:hypothetical protein [Thermoguttaceae bacterium]MDW8078688.1 hypothetical protein [Thermoguttaceae bacterium]